jgi:endonuclease YncB( thermonuclease family)
LPVALLFGMPAAALLWDAIERPLPSLGFLTPAAADTFDGRSAVIIDGDTIALGRERVRILNIDTPETHEPRCERELVAGLKAKERLAQLVRVGAVAIERNGKDRYGRTLATLSASGRDIGTVLIEEGLAVPWRDGSAARATRVRHWCG